MRTTRLTIDRHDRGRLVASGKQDEALILFQLQNVCRVALLLVGLLLVAFAPRAEATVKTYQTFNVQADGTTQDTACSGTTTFTSGQTIGMLEEPLSCTGTKQDAIKWTFGATESTNETDLLVTYFNTGYLVDTVVTGQSTGNDINFKSKNVGGTFRIKLVEANPTTGAVITVLDTHSEAAASGATLSITDLSDLTGTVGIGNTFGFQFTFQAENDTGAQIQLLFGSYASAGKRLLYHVYEEPDLALLTAVELISFTATGYDRGVLVEWRTGYEVDNLGFNVYREVDGERTQLTPALIAGSGLLGERGVSVTSELAYAWWDMESSSATPGLTYWLEDVDLDGTSTWHGPVTPVDGGHLIDVGPPYDGEGVKGDNSRSIAGLAKAKGARRRLFFTGDHPLDRKGRRGTDAVRQTPLETQWWVAGQPGVKIGVQAPGWYRVGQAALVAAGLDPDADPHGLRLFVDGVEQAMTVAGAADGRFDPGDAVEFYGQGVDTAFTDTRVYWLVAGSERGQRIVVADGRARGGKKGKKKGTKDAGPSSGASFWGTLEQKDRSIYFAALDNGDAENWFGTLVWAYPTDLVLTASHLDPAAPGAAELEVTLRGVTSLDETPDHRVGVLVNGTEVGELIFDGTDEGVGTFAVPHALLREGANTVSLFARGVMDYSLVDTLRLSYWHTYQADGDRLRFTAEGRQTVTVGGFANGTIRVVDITDPAAVQEVLVEVAPEMGGRWSTTLQVPGSGTRTLLAWSAATVGAPAFVTANRPSSWHDATQTSDYLVITHDTFTEPLKPLIALRAAQGHAAALIDIQDVYDEFSFGQKDPQAIKDFLTRAQTRWQRSPRFVVLAGDATVDPRDYAGFGDADFVPTKLVAMDSVQLETATDDWFADMDGDDLADLAVGRLPMRTVEHAETMVSKLVSYDQAAAGAWTKQIVLLSDEGDSTWSFEARNAQLKAALPDGYTAHEIFAGAGVAAARAELFDRVSDGQLLVNYLGHGSTTIWGQSGLLTSGDLTSQWRAGPRLPVVVAMNCLNGLFQGIYGEESLAETFLRAPGGAVAIWASSSITNAVPQAVANQAFFRLVFAGGSATIGENVVAAKAAVTDRDVRRSWIFFGDPAMRLKGVPYATNARDRLTSTPTAGPVRLALNDTDSDADATPSESDDAGTTGAAETADAFARHLADFDGDGRDDVLTYAAETGLWTLAFADTHGFRYVAGMWPAHAHLVAAHLTDDRRTDVFGYNEQTGDWFQALNTADGTFTTYSGAWTPGWQTALGDLDGDGRDDVFLSDPGTGLWFQSLTDGAGGFSYHGGHGLPAGIVHLADFNADRRADLFVYDAATTGRWFIGVNDAAGGFAYAGGEATPGWTAHVANLDGDDWADLFLFEPASGGWVEWLTDTSGAVTYTQGQWTAGGDVGVADFNGDGLDDLFWHDPATGAWAGHVNRGPGKFKATQGQWPSGRTVAVGDLDGDGRDGLFVYDPETGAWSRYLTGDSKTQDTVGLVEESGTWVPGLSIVGRP